MERNIINKINAIIAFSVVIAVGIYFLLSNQFPKNSFFENIFPILNIILVGVQMFCYNKLGFLNKLFDRGKYIEGEYTGYSTLIPNSPARQIEKVIIKQTLLFTTILGYTRVDPGPKSDWRGHLIKYDGNNYIFFIELENEKGVMRSILSLSRTDNGFNGYYYSTTSVENKARIVLKKIKK